MNYNNPFYYPLYNGRYPYFENFSPLDKPPTLYSILNAHINFGSDTYVKTGDLAAAGRTFVFDFNYTLSEEINKEDFEELFIDHFLERRIGFETFNSFKIHLRAKLREILPYYNTLFDALADLKIIYNDTYMETLKDTVQDEFTETLDRDGTSETVTDGTKTETGTIGTAGNETHTGTDTVHTQDYTKFSDTPQNQLSNVTQNKYMTDYTDRDTTNTETRNLADSHTQTQTFNKNYGDDTTVSGSLTDDYRKENARTTSHEYTKNYMKPFANQMENYQKYLETKQSILTLLLNDLEDLFLLIY